MASAVDSRLAYARLSAVATASRLPTANRGSNNSYTTSWDTTYQVDLDGDLHDLRGQKAAQPLVYHNDNYAAGQHLARTLREAGSNGIAYDSVRRTGGECVAVFRPPLLSNARQERHLCYVWNGQNVETVYEKREIGDEGQS